MKTVLQTKDYAEVDGEPVRGCQLSVKENGTAVMKAGPLIIRERLTK